MPGTRAAVKRAMLGRARSSRELGQQLLPRWRALPIFSSDPLSSVAYATQEMMLVLVLVGTGAFVLIGPVAAAVAALLVVVVWNYRHMVRAYPRGGGAYSVARENLGQTPGLVAAGALLLDYTLTVAVSVAAGVAAITSAFPALAPHRLWLALGLVAVVTLANLRGVRETSVLFTVPTYLFVVTILSLIGVGLVRCAVGGCPDAPLVDVPLAAETTQALTLFIVLRAFAAGATALTGLEAISNGVPAFRYPQGSNAASTLGIMGALAVTMFLGVSFLAVGTGAVPTEHGQLTVIAQIAQAVFGTGAGFYLVQVATVMILVLAANTAYAGFPRLASVLARDRWLPRQFLARGDRLVFSNGVIALAIAASLLLVIYRVNVTELVQLYLVGVFTSFTLAQAGMARHWSRTREPGWHRRAALDVVGATGTGMVLAVVAATRFLDGAWLVIAAIVGVVIGMRGINRHYRDVSAALRTEVADVPSRRAHHSILLIDRVDEAAARALSYAFATQPASIRVKAVPVPGEDVEGRWRQLAPDVPIELLGSARSRGVVKVVSTAVRAETERRGGQAFTDVIIAETLSRTWVEQLTVHRLALRLKRRLLAEGQIVTNVTSPIGGPGPYTVEEPVEHHVVVLVSAVNSSVLRAVSYAHGLAPTSVRALSINLDPERSQRILDEWEDWGVDIPVELVDSPFRSLTASIRDYVRAFAPDGRHTVVTCVLPEFVLGRWYHQPLHNQTALAVKAALLFERGVVTTSVPYPLEPVLRQARRRAEHT